MSASKTSTRKTGVWLVGACGGVATLAALGARAVVRGLRPPTGLLTATRLFDGLDLPALEDLVFGGHEIRSTDLHCAATEFARRAGILDPALLTVLRDDIEAIDANIQPGFLVNAGEAVEALADKGHARIAASPAEVVAGMQADWRAFAEAHDLETIIVVNVSSTEPPAPVPIEFASLTALRERIEEGEHAEGLGCSVLTSYAALDMGLPTINFTPSPGSAIPALQELALSRGVPHMGADGKTGETLVKTALAPMFASRALRVLSWEGYNMLGNRDGFVLNDPAARESKTRSKDHAIRQILGDDDTHSRVTIDYVPSLDDWKVAWDYIHFEGFMGARMSMQFTWQGNDSALAAPLVLDLVRLAAFAKAKGERGLLKHTAAYFKSPTGVEEQNFVKQFALLEQYVARHRQATTSQGERDRG